MTVEFVTSVGRIVWGNPARATTKKDQKTNQPIMRDGQPVQQWVFGIAFPKAEFQQYVLPYLQQAVGAVFPHGVPPQFSWKIKDGDGVDRKGKPYREREGYAGNFVLTISTEAFAPPIYKNEGGRYRQMNENEIKTGDYCVVKLNVKANAPTNPQHTPGLYINPVGIEHVGYGQEIIASSADPDEMFGGRTYALPPGASAVPQAPVSTVAAPYNAASAPAPMGNGFAPVAAGMPPAMTPSAVTVAPAPNNAYMNAPAQPVFNYAPQPATMPAPAHDFVQNAGNPAPVAYNPPPAQPVAYNPAQPGQPPAPVNYAAMPGTMPGR